MSEQVDILQDDDGDLLLVFPSMKVKALRAEDYKRVRVSAMGHPVKKAERYPLSQEESFNPLIEKVPADRAELMAEHGCTHADLELDRMIWAAAYVSAFERTIYAPSPGGRRCLGEPKLEPAERARFAGLEADAVVLARWKVKG